MTPKTPKTPKTPNTSKLVGFTLIELLVVISIISLLASVVLASLGSARASGRDAKRLTEARQIQTALEMYYAANGNYPHGGWVNSSAGNWQTSYLANALEPYMSYMPIDPTNNTTSIQGNQGLSYSYFSTAYGSSGPNDNHWYMLVFNLEGNEQRYRDLDIVTGCDGFNFTTAYPNSIVWSGCVR